MFSTVAPAGVPTLTKDQMIEVDRIMVEDLGIDLVRMMENAGRALARLVQARVGARTGTHATFLVGSGGNGGGALVAARRLTGWKWDVSVYTSRPTGDYSGVIGEQLTILENLGVPIHDHKLPDSVGLTTALIDGLVGYSLAGAPHGRTAELILWANDQTAPTISLDVPSGFSAATASVLSPAISADATLTLALPKIGLEGATENVGDLYCADIGVPASLYREAFDIDIGDLFRESDIVRIAGTE
ncbi:MAG: NAD(P)H-hydrate epimerase [Acidimicrobiia bacterium]